MRGRVLEVREPGYTTAYGGDNVTAANVVDVDPENEQATVVADLSSPESLTACGTGSIPSWSARGRESLWRRPA